MNKEYIGYLDYCRALGAICVVMAHSGLDSMQHIMVFVLPMFFVLSGFVYDPSKRTKKEFIKGRFRRLVIPFWYLTAMYAAVEAVRSHVLGYGTLKNLLTFPMYMLYGSSILAPATGLTQAASAFSYPYAMAFGRVYIASPSANHLWFLPALFTGSILFCLLEEKTRKGLLAKIVAVISMLAVSYLDSAVSAINQLPWAIGSGSLCAACMLCGYWARQYHFMDKSKRFLTISAIVGLAFAVLAECLGSTGGGTISSYYGPYGVWSVLLNFAGGLGGTCFVMCVMKKLEELPLGHSNDGRQPDKIESLKHILSLVGKASMEVYEYQMFFLFIFGYAFLLITGIAPQLDVWLLGFIPVTPVTTVFMVAESLAIVALITWIVTRRRNRAQLHR